MKRFGFTFEDEGGFAGATRAVEDERLRDAVVLGVVVQHGFQEWPWDYSPCFVHHFLWVFADSLLPLSSLKPLGSVCVRGIRRVLACWHG